MELQINPDPQELNGRKKNGRKGWQYICIGIAVAVVFIITMFTDMNNNLNSLICAVIVAPFGYVGLFNKNGIDYFEYRRKKRDSMSGRNIFLYETEKYSHEKNMSEENGKKKKEKKIKKVRGEKLG